MANLLACESREIFILNMLLPNQLDLMSELHNYLSPDEFYKDDIDGESYTIATVWPDDNVIWDEPNVYYANRHSDYQPGDILYYNINSETFEVHPLASTGNLPNLSAATYKPIGVCCMNGLCMPDGLSRFVLVKSIDNWMSADDLAKVNLPEHNKVIKDTSAFPWSAESDITPISVPYEYNADLGNLNASNNTGFVTHLRGSSFVATSENIIAPPFTSKEQPMMFPDVAWHVKGDHANVTGDFFGSYNTQRIAGTILSFKATWKFRLNNIQDTNIALDTAYIPAVGELYCMFGNYATVQNSIQKIKAGGFTADNLGNSFLSSTGYKDSQIFHISECKLVAGNPTDVIPIRPFIKL